MYRYFILAYLCLVPVSCRYQGQDEVSYDIDLFNQENLADFISVFDSVSLKQPEDYLISEISKFQCDSEYFYLQDRDVVLVYNRKGDYISKVSRKGRAGNEYVSITDYSVYASRIYVLSNPQRKINIYEIDGEYVGMIPLNDWYHNLSVEENYILLYSERSNSQKYDIIKIDFNGNVLDKFLPFKTDCGVMYKISPFNRVADGEYLLTFPFDHRLYFLSDGGCIPYCNINIKDIGELPPRELDKLNYDEIKKLVGGKDYLRRIIYASKSGSKLNLIVEVYLRNRAIRNVLCQIDLLSGQVSSYLCGEDLDSKFPYINASAVLVGDMIYSVLDPLYMHNVNDLINGTTSEIDVNNIGSHWIYTYKIATE